VVEKKDRNGDVLMIPGILSEGYGIVPRRVMADRDICPMAKVLYSYFCSFAGEGSDRLPEMEKICRDLGISRKAFRRYLKELVKKDYIRLKHRIEGKTMVYEIVIKGVV
jgi:AraC-like DNA-binding protein